MTDIFQFLNGKRYTHNDIDGVFRFSESRAIYPYPHTVTAFYHEPNAAGRASEAYRETRRKLGDDWSSDLTQAFDTVARIASELGYGQ